MAALREMKPMGWGVVVLLTTIMIVASFVFAVIVANGGAVLGVVGAIVLVALIVLFNIVLFAPISSAAHRRVQHTGD